VCDIARVDLAFRTMKASGWLHLQTKLGSFTSPCCKPLNQIHKEAPEDFLFAEAMGKLCDKNPELSEIQNL